ncbi:hypothetical protein VNO77_20114 [Canavalia gladiata]|uniref:Uncharacterized protein n=1 Tax=Canavalia gladiata TaxID=3824 RepID=A0AAN9LPK5_CANGL
MRVPREVRGIHELVFSLGNHLLNLLSVALGSRPLLALEESRLVIQLPLRLGDFMCNDLPLDLDYQLALVPPLI